MLDDMLKPVVGIALLAEADAIRQEAFALDRLAVDRAAS
jgi:hypothetical protein